MAVVLSARAASLPTIPTIDKQSALAVRSDVERALWVWNSEDIVYNVGTAKSDFFSFCENPKGIDDPAAPTFAHKSINHLFLYSRGFVVSGQEEMDSLRSFLREAHTRGMRVDFLDGEPTWINKAAGEANQIVNNVMTFNKQGLPEERFDGVMLDVQPYQLRGWYTPTLWNQYTAFLRSMSAKVHASDKSLPFGVTIPRWYDATLGQQSVVDVYSNVNYVAVLDYVDEERALLESVASEIQLADSMNIRVYTGVETASNVLPNVTFQEDGWFAMEHALASLRSTYMFNKSFAGIAISSYSSYRGLRRAAHSIDPSATMGAQVGSSIHELLRSNSDVVVLDRAFDHVAGLQKKDIQKLQNSNGRARMVLAGMSIATFLKLASKTGVVPTDELRWTRIGQNSPSPEMIAAVTKLLSLGFDGFSIDVESAAELAEKMNDPALENAIVSTIQSVGNVARVHCKHTNAVVVVRGGESMLTDLDADSYSQFAGTVDGILPLHTTPIPAALVSTLSPERARVYATLAQMSRNGIKVFGDFQFGRTDVAGIETAPSTSAVAFVTGQ